MLSLGTTALLLFAGSFTSISEGDTETHRARKSASSEFAMSSVAGAWRAHNPTQDWNIEFDGRAFQARPASGAWAWGLQLESYGFDQDQRVVFEPARVFADGNRLTYEWGTGLQEWYINDSRGLEHGYTLAQRPDSDCGTGPLILELAVQGPWDCAVSRSGTDVTFTHQSGIGAVDYAGLYAFDAMGRELAAWFEWEHDRLNLHVDESLATYPITIDPVAQQLYIKASNTEEFDLFGYSVAISGDTMVMGAINEDSASNVINGDQSDNSAPDAGAAYVFVRQGGAWVQEAYLKASNAEAGDNFGHSVAISGDTIVVSALMEASAATGVDGDASDNAAWGAGAAYVFVREGGVWTQQAYLKASNAGAGDNFGWEVAVSGDTVAVTAYFEMSNGTGVDGDQLDNSLFEAGAAYVFQRTGTTWSQQAYVKPLQIDSGDLFGWCMALHQDTLVIGSNKEGSAATGVNGDDTDNSAPKSGAAYVFTRTADTWSQTAYIKASNTDQGDRFACGLDYTGGLLVIGATYEDSNATTTDGDQLDNSVPSAGAAYVFEWTGTEWEQIAYLKPPLVGLRDHFGEQIAVEGERIVIGAYDEDSSATGMNGDMTNDDAHTAGAVWVYEKVGNTWHFQTYVKASNTSEGGAFAHSIDLQGSTLLVGAPGENSSSTGMNGDQGNGTAPAAGAAYLFNLEGTSPQVPFCFGDGTGGTCPCGVPGALGAGCPGSLSTGAVLSSGGQAFVTADSLNFQIENSTPGSPGLLLQGNAQFGGGGLVVGNGLLCSQSQKRWPTMVSDATGAAAYGPDQFGSHHHAVPGATLFYQWWYRDPSDPCGGGFNFSNAVAVTWQ